MRYAVISDIHANPDALKAVLAEIDRLSADKIVCLGDIVGGGAYPEETVQMIRRRGDIDCVKGNHDIFSTIDLSSFRTDDTRLRLFRWQQRVMSGSSKSFLSSLPTSRKYFDCGLTVDCRHYPMNEKGRFRELVYLPTEEQIRALFRGMKGDVFLFGHEHTGSQTVIGNRYFLNFGTVGNFLYPDTALFGVVDIENGRVGYRSVKVSYDDSRVRKRTEEIRAVLYARQD